MAPPCPVNKPQASFWLEVEGERWLTEQRLQAWTLVQVPAAPRTSCVTSGKLLNLSELSILIH